MLRVCFLGGKTRRTKDGGSPGEGIDQDAKETLIQGCFHAKKPINPSFFARKLQLFNLFQRKIGQLTLERVFLQDCFRACDLLIPEYDKSEE